MSVTSLWVVVEPANGTLTTTSLELLSHARTLASNVSAITWGNGASFAAQAGEYGATTLYDVGALDGSLPGVPVASAIATLVQSVGAPDAILIPTSYDGRDIAGRLSARLDRPVLTNVTGLLDEGGLVTEHPVFGGTQTVKARFTGEGPGLIVVRA
jgi:electron transfer flavoprotein alpha subunit